MREIRCDECGALEADWNAIAAKASALREENSRLRTALRPFAESTFFEKEGVNVPDEHLVVGGAASVTAGDFRVAKDAFQQLTSSRKDSDGR